eukprot:SAG11_NODE_254_length_11587_cov_4.312913_8_plen_150_part_00
MRARAFWAGRVQNWSSHNASYPMTTTQQRYIEPKRRPQHLSISAAGEWLYQHWSRPLEAWRQPFGGSTASRAHQRTPRRSYGASAWTTCLTFWYSRYLGRSQGRSIDDYSGTRRKIRIYPEFYHTYNISRVLHSEYREVVNQLFNYLLN